MRALVLLSSVLAACGSTAITDDGGVATHTYASIVTDCVLSGGMPGPTCVQSDEYMLANDGSATHVYTCGSDTKTTTWQISPDHLIGIHALIENYAIEDATYDCSSGGSCTVDVGDQSATFVLDGDTKTVVAKGRSSTVPSSLQSILDFVCALPDAPT